MYSGMPTMEMNSHLNLFGFDGFEFSRGRRASRHTYTILNTRYNINNSGSPIKRMARDVARMCLC